MADAQQQKLNNHKVKEYFALLKTKTTQELVELRDYVRNLFHSERAKETPDGKAIQNHNIKLSLIGRILKGRQPVDQQDKSQVAHDKTVGEVKPKTFEEKLKGKSLDELNSMLAIGKKKLEELNTKKSEPNISQERQQEIEDRINHFGKKSDSIQAEILTRSSTAAAQAKEELKKDTNGAQKKILGIESDYAWAGIVGGVIAGAIAGKMEKNILGYAALGIGAGAGLVWLSKNVSLAKPAPAPATTVTP